MSAPISIVTGFLAEWAKGRDALHAAHRKYFTETTVWENVGVSTTMGVEDALNFIREFEKRWGKHTIEVDLLGACAAGDVVMTERVDRFVAPDGRMLFSVRVMGVFEVRGDRIVAWRDYFNPHSVSAA